MTNKTLNMPAQGGSARGGKLLMITGDRALAQGKKGPFYYTLEEFSKYWERIDIICPRVYQTSSIEHRTSNLQPFPNVFIHSSPWPLIFQPCFILKKGTEIFKKEKFDIFGVHSYPPFYNDIGGLWLYKRIKKPYVSEIHHITGYPRAGSFKEGVYRALTGLFINKFAKKAKAIRVVNKKQTPEFLIKSGVDKNKIIYASSAYIDFETFKPMGLEKKYDIVFAGRLTKNKGIMLLLGAVKELKFKIQNLKLVIIGSGPLEKKIKNFIKQNQLGNNIEFSGWLPGMEDVAKVYNQSKIFVMPSFNEGGPRVNLEAMACNVAVITSRVGLMIDIIKDKENGLFVDWSSKDIADKIMLLLKNDELRNKIAGAGFETAKQFERIKAIKNYADSYRALLK